MNSSLQHLSALLQTQWHQVLLAWQPLDAAIEGFIYYYPLFMAYIWMFGAIIFYSRYEWHQQGNAEHLPELKDYSPVSILIPCYNEAENIRETIDVLLRQKSAILIMAKSYSVSAFGEQAIRFFRYIRPAFQHEIEQVFPAIEA